MVLVVGLLFIAAGVALSINLAGSADFVIRHLTSRSLGTLAPGYAASPGGFRIYSFLLAGIGAVFAGIGLIDRSGSAGLYIAGLGLVVFVILSVLVIVGEVRTYRALKR